MNPVGCGRLITDKANQERPDRGRPSHPLHSSAALEQLKHSRPTDHEHGKCEPDHPYPRCQLGDPAHLWVTLSMSIQV